MALSGETAGLHGVTCDCGADLRLDVLQSAAGFYLGYFCDRCGPWSRETDYYSSRASARFDLNRWLKGGRLPLKLR